MKEEGFPFLITSYIESRANSKLEAFEKEADKKLAALIDSEKIAVAQLDIAQQRRDLQQKYEVRVWLTDAANRAGQINLVTHALKFTHSDARGSSRFQQFSSAKPSAYLSTATLRQPAIDAVGNAAVLDVAKLLQTEYEGETLIDYLKRDDFSPLAPLAESEQQLMRWVEGFKQVLVDKQLSSHKLAKQLYFPVAGNEYHLLSPLFSSSLTHAMHQRVIEARFSDLAKEIFGAFKAKKWHPLPYVRYLDTAVQTVGGTKPQNISYLNSVRGGRNLLLSCAAPTWQSKPEIPGKHISVFNKNSEFSRKARPVIRQLSSFLLSVKTLKSNIDIRNRRLAFTDEIIDILFNYVAGVQNLGLQNGWSKNDDCKLKLSQKLWLDPGRVKYDYDFRFERDGGDWKKEIALDFGEWLNRQLKHEALKLGEVERREWSTVKLFKKRLCEFERMVKEDLI